MTRYLPQLVVIVVLSVVATLGAFAAWTLRSIGKAVQLPEETRRD
jgi:hypothetical protein